MKKVTLALALAAFVVVAGYGYSTVEAKTNYQIALASPKPSTSPSPSASPTPTEVNSFDLFWPLAPGKTRESKLYFLKTLKEKIRGFLIFGSAQKADYKVFLSVKRLIEADSLMQGNKTDLANATLQDAQNDIDSAASNAAKANKEDLSPLSGQIKDRLTKMNKLIDWLMFKYPDSKSSLESLNSKISSLSTKI